MRNNPTTLVLSTTFAWSGVNASVTPAEAMPALLISTSMRLARASTSSTALIDGRVVADIELDDLDSLFTERRRMLSVLSFRVAHRGEHDMAARAKVSAVSRPKPVLAPVIRIVLGMVWFLLDGRIGR